MLVGLRVGRCGILHRWRRRLNRNLQEKRRERDGWRQGRRGWAFCNLGGCVWVLSTDFMNLHFSAFPFLVSFFGWLFDRDAMDLLYAFVFPSLFFKIKQPGFITFLSLSLSLLFPLPPPPSLPPLSLFQRRPSQVPRLIKPSTHRSPPSSPSPPSPPPLLPPSAYVPPPPQAQSPFNLPIVPIPIPKTHHLQPRPEEFRYSVSKYPPHPYCCHQGKAKR